MPKRASLVRPLARRLLLTLEISVRQGMKKVSAEIEIIRKFKISLGPLQGGGSHYHHPGQKSKGQGDRRGRESHHFLHSKVTTGTPFRQRGAASKRDYGRR